MDIVLVNGENKQVIYNLISPEKYENIGAEGVLTIAAANEKGQALGVLQLQLNRDYTAELLWLFVAEEVRKQGVATFLCEKSVELLKGISFREISVILPEIKEAEGLITFLQVTDFVFLSITDDLTAIPLSVLEARLRGGVNPNANILSLAQIPERIWRSRMSDLAKAVCDDGLMEEELFSAGIVRNEQLKAIALIEPREDGKGIALLQLESEDPRDVFTLLHFVTKKALVKYPEGYITIATMNGLGNKLGSMIREATRVETILNGSRVIRADL